MTGKRELVKTGSNQKLKVYGKAACVGAASVTGTVLGGVMVLKGISKIFTSIKDERKVGGVIGGAFAIACGIASVVGTSIASDLATDALIEEAITCEMNNAFADDDEDSAETEHDADNIFKFAERIADK